MAYQVDVPIHYPFMSSTLFQISRWWAGRQWAVTGHRRWIWERMDMGVWWPIRGLGIFLVSSSWKFRMRAKVTECPNAAGHFRSVNGPLRCGAQQLRRRRAPNHVSNKFYLSTKDYLVNCHHRCVVAFHRAPACANDWEGVSSVSSSTRKRGSGAKLWATCAPQASWTHRTYRAASGISALPPVLSTEEKFSLPPCSAILDMMQHTNRNTTLGLLCCPAGALKLCKATPCNKFFQQEKMLNTFFKRCVDCTAPRPRQMDILFSRHPRRAPSTARTARMTPKCISDSMLLISIR